MKSYEYSVQNKYSVNEELTLRNAKEKEKECSSLFFTTLVQLLAQKIIFDYGKKKITGQNFLIKSVFI